MQELTKRLTDLQSDIAQALISLKVSDLEVQAQTLQKQSEATDFWQDQRTAQDVMKKLAKLQSRINPWRNLERNVKEARELALLNDDSVKKDLEKQLELQTAEFRQLKKELQFSGPYDDHDVILSVHAGAGGTDAQDWAQMLLRMYVRWAEKHNVSIETVDESTGEEAGIKSATIEISGPFLYGKLKGEHGVHRLVRLSPFNADNLRQTSFAKVEVVPKLDQPEDLLIDDKDLKVDVYRSGGHGGQSVNTTDSAVRVTHEPTGITVAIQNERSQLQNKETAMTILRSRLAQLKLEQHKEKVEEIKGPNQSAEWGNQIRSYVLHPYKQVKDLRTRYESSDPDSVLDGEIDPFIEAYLEQHLGA